MLAAGVGALQSLTGEPKSYISDLKLPAIQRGVLEACDTLDGVKDGVIGNPAKCHFDPEVLACKAEDGPDCLTQPQIDSLKSLYVGIKDPRGKVIFPGFSMGDETGWKEWVVGEDPGASLSARFVQNYFRYIVTANPKRSCGS
jgi:feruloyl esterase